jgi:hypothetical protein
MIAMKSNVLYILGAGCSAAYGYPLAKEFPAALKNYEISLQRRPNCGRLKRCVTNTISLMGKYHSPTTDRLVFQIAEELGRERRKLGPIFTPKHKELEAMEEEQILDAKTATTAFFLEQEAQARATGLQGYWDFLTLLFENNRNPSVLESTTSRVLSFNYDRLFEIAFTDYFRLDSNPECYRQVWLNSGIDLLLNRAVDFLPGRFSFLKLHGTAGIFVRREIGSVWYSGVAIHQEHLTIEDNFFWHSDPTRSSFQRLKAEPLIVFPFEKDRARSENTSFLYDDYIRAVWGHAKQQGYAEGLVERAKQIQVIGYSFDRNDRKAMIDLLQKSDCPIIIRNRTKEDAQDICQGLEEDHPELAPRLRPSPKGF